MIHLWQWAAFVSRYTVIQSPSVFVLCRVGLVQARCLSWTSTVPGMEFEVVTDICVTCVIYWKEQRVGLLLTPLFFTTASLFVPLMSMGTGDSRLPKKITTKVSKHLAYVYFPTEMTFSVYIFHCRYCFPFGRPEGALKATLSLLERVLMKDIVTPVPPEEVKGVIRKCLEQAAQLNYERIQEYATIEGKKREMFEHPVFCLASQVMDLTILEKGQKDQKDPENVGRLVTPAKKLEETIRLAELVIEVLQQNQEHHAEAFAWWTDLMVEHAENFLALYAIDMDAALEIQSPESWDSFPLFQLLNDFLRNDYHLCNGKFHKHLQDLYAPLVVRYVDLMESSIAQSIHKGFDRESWEPVKSLTSNLPNVNLPNVNLQIPKVPNLPVPVAGLSVNLPQMPSFSTPSWMAAIYDSECPPAVF
ncbi:hypothetical protein F7725_016970 [Dissostichus mawsoni]|uniref:MHD1 domain-containing protein n=1 Tax=Dissostichus mawsoni TaxID=36200 RepID=A0A7J5Z646_DISMA|nr:hypothetical protein F7725_016970 [Dissostichus mawsoni]